jgi:hypothetical protein
LQVMQEIAMKDRTPAAAAQSALVAAVMEMEGE